MRRTRTWLALCCCLVVLTGCGEPPPPPPAGQVTQVAPNTARPRMTISVQGTGLGAQGTATLGGKPLKVTNWTDRGFAAVVPDDMAPGDHPLVVTAKSEKLEPVKVKILAAVPELISSDPDTGKVGDEVTVKGKNLGTKEGGKLSFLGAPVTEIKAWTNTAITFKIPPAGDANSIWLEVPAASATSNELSFRIIKPQVSSIEPERTVPGAVVTIVGKNFGEKGRVLFGTSKRNQQEGKVASWADGLIKVALPLQVADTGELAVRVANENGASFPVAVHIISPPPNGQVSATPLLGQWPRLVLDAQELPHVFYWNKATAAPYHYRWNGQDWVGGEIPMAALVRKLPNENNVGLLTANHFRAAMGQFPAVAMDSNGRMHMSSYDLHRMRIIYSVWDPVKDKWTVQKLEPYDVKSKALGTFFSAIGIEEATSKAHIVYTYLNPGSLRHAIGDLTGFKVQIADQTPGVGFVSSLAVDGKGVPHWAHLDSKNFDLRYGNLKDGQYTAELVAGDGWTGDCPSLVVDPTGVPHIAYGEREASGKLPDKLHFAHRSGGRWQFEVIDRGPGAAHPNLARALDGRYHCVYMDMEQKKIKHAVRTAPGKWKVKAHPAEDIDATMDFGRLRMALGRDARPRVVYYGGEQKEKCLMFKTLPALEIVEN
jgi:hypothetical protein